MSDQDLPNLDDEITSLPEDVRRDIADHGKNDLYFFDKAILGFHDMTPRCHMPVCVFINENPAQFKEILYPRDHFKTSCVTVGGTMQKVIRNPEERMLISNESATNAGRMLRTIREKSESNRVFRSLYSSIIPKNTKGTRWNDEELQFNREGQYAEPTIDSIGMTGAFTSRHYTHITIDDPISEEAVKSEKVMKDTITRLSSFLSLLTKPELNTIWMVGTRWALHDCYSWFEGHMRMFPGRFAKFACSVYGPDGEPIFPELMGHDILALKRQVLGEYRFSCLYLNNPRNEELQDLNINDLKWWRWKDDETIELLAKSELADSAVVVERTVKLDQLDITVTVDLASAEKIKDDRNAVVTCGTTPWGEAIVLDAWGKRCTPLEVIEKLFEIKRRFQPRVFGIEDVAYQKSLKYFVRDYANREGIYLNVKPITAVGKKEVRIRGIQPVMATGRMYLLPTHALLRNEMADFPLGEHDDLVDALSMHLQLWPNRMSPEHWARVQAEEKKLIARIKRGNSPAHGSRKERQDFDHDDEDHDDLPGVVREQWQEASLSDVA